MSIETADQETTATGSPHARRMPTDVVTDVIRLYANGWSLREIKNEVGYSYGAVRGALLRAHVRLRPRGRARVAPE